jgi:hypothetical protein
MAGTRRSTPKGELLKGVNEKTYWTSDGRTEFFVGLFPTKNMGAELPSSLPARMADLGIDLSLDVYPGKIPHNNAIHRIADKSGSR